MSDPLRVPDPGWYVERDGRRLALLTDPSQAAPGWISYRLQPLTDDPGELERLHSDAFWADAGRLVFRTGASGEAVSGVCVGGSPGWLLRHQGRLLVRGLRLDRPHPLRSDLRV
jgi:hypothetical protein